MNRTQPRSRKPLRLSGYDYSQNGAYFVTLVTQSRECFFGNPVYATIVRETWAWLETNFSNVMLDEFIVMPNHVHGILVIDNNSPRRGESGLALPDAPINGKPLGQIIGAFKTRSARQINDLSGTPGTSVWQRDFYEHVIREDADLERTRQYIVDNPAKWDEDPENPGRDER